MTNLMEYGERIRKFPRNEHVEIHVREVTLLPGTPDEKNYVDVREFILNGSVYGNGILLPVGLIQLLTPALMDVLVRQQPVVEA